MALWIFALYLAIVLWCCLCTCVCVYVYIYIYISKEKNATLVLICGTCWCFIENSELRVCVLTAVQAQKCGHSGGGWNTGGWWDVGQWTPGITGQQYGPNYSEKDKTIVNHIVENIYIDYYYFCLSNITGKLYFWGHDTDDLLQLPRTTAHRNTALQKALI